MTLVVFDLDGTFLDKAPRYRPYRRDPRQNAGPQYPLHRRNGPDIAGRHWTTQGPSLHAAADSQKWAIIWSPEEARIAIITC
ncbi:MAG: hypothetical protein CM15mP125_1650 [Gammaproteobacteria bacterium]|nr:MAG: hypothetical protein CM15mP125_1650 [Gammaproteobacteria bacterium]